MLPSISQGGVIHMFIPLIIFVRLCFVSRRFLVLLKYTFRIFLHFRLFDGFRFQYFQVLVIYLFSRCLNFFFILKFYSFPYLSSYNHPYEHGTFFYAKIHSYILIYILNFCIRIFNSLSFLCN